MLLASSGSSSGSSSSAGPRGRGRTGRRLAHRERRPRHGRRRHQRRLIVGHALFDEEREIGRGQGPWALWDSRVRSDAADAAGCIERTEGIAAAPHRFRLVARNLDVERLLFNRERELVAAVPAAIVAVEGDVLALRDIALLRAAPGGCRSARDGPRALTGKARPAGARPRCSCR